MQYGCHGFLQGTYVIKRLRWPKQPIQSRSILWLEVTILISYKSQRVTKCSSSESFLLPDRNSSQKIHHHLCFPSDYKVKQHPWLSSHWFDVVLFGTAAPSTYQSIPEVEGNKLLCSSSHNTPQHRYSKWEAEKRAVVGPTCTQKNRQPSRADAPCTGFSSRWALSTHAHT